jgi:hypothetical protein
MPKVQIVINVYGGVVQDVYCSATEAELIVVDWDTDLCDESQSGLVQITEETGDKRLAFVSRHLPEPLEALAGTDVETAIQQSEANSAKEQACHARTHENSGPRERRK